MLGIVIILFLASLFRKEKPGMPIVSPTPTTAASTTPTIAPGQLLVISSLPEQNPAEPYVLTQKITLVFNDDVLPENVYTETSPQTELSIIQGTEPNIIYIIPQTTWRDGETEITILQKTFSSSGSRMFSPYVYIMKAGAPVDPFPDEVLP